MQLCTKGRGSLSQRLGQMGLLEARPARTAGSQVDPPQVSRRCDGVALRAELLGTLRRRGRAPSDTGDLCLRTGALGLQPCLHPCAGTSFLSASLGRHGLPLSRQTCSCVGETPGSNRLASPAAGALVMRTRLGPAVAASALTRLHAAFDQDTEPTSGPFIAVSGRHFNGCS